MENLRVKDVRLRGRGFTLYPATKEAGENVETMDNILWILQHKVGTVNDEGFTYEQEVEVENQNPELPLEFTEKDSMWSGKSLDNAINSALIKKNGDVYFLTKKAIDILLDAARKQKELDKSGFHFCPCNMF